MRILRQRALVCAVWLIGATSTALAQPMQDPNVVPSGHLIHKGANPGCADVNVVVELEQSKSSSKSDNECAAHGKRCCLLCKHSKHGAPSGYSAVGNILYTPAMFSMSQPTANVVSSNFGVNIDLAGLRSLQEIGRASC